jgi:large repetitive protein
MKKVIFVFTVLFAVCAIGSVASAYQIPYEDSRVREFYVFGPDGDPLMGTEDSTQEIIVDVPADEPGYVVIEVYDPDTANFVDWRVPGSDWDTTCKIEVIGKGGVIDSEKFGVSPEWDQKWYMFGPYDKTQGEKVGDMYRFRLVVTGLSGDDQNLFKVRISPDSAESYCEKITFRLLPNEGDMMYFYPGVPAGTKSITVENYDLDVNGGTSTLSVDTISKKYRIGGSESGEWRSTVVPISTETGGRMVYIITKGTQRYANAGLRMKTDKGETIPIYFRRGTPPVTKAAPAPVKPAPVMAPKTDLKCNKFTFDATSSYDLDKQKLSFLWNFGDGNTSTEPVVTHIYEKGGEYTVTLSVKDDSGLPCDSGVTSQKVFVNTPPQAAFSAPELVCAFDKVSFDASRTTDDNPENLTYAWNLGDGTRAEGQKVTHSYGKGGTYNVTLTVDDNSQTACNLDTIQKTIDVNTSPVANAGSDINMCLKSLDEDYVVVFDAGLSRDPDGDALVYTWSMGDGTTEQGQKVRHVYGKSGDYKVNLVVDDGKGLPCSKASDTVNVSLNKPPVAVAGGDRKACAGQSVSFDASSSRTEPGETLSYKWAFGDGQEATGQKVSHVYDKGGKHTVVLTVDDGRGTVCSMATDVAIVHVNSRPVASLNQVKDTCVGKKVHFDASGSKDTDGDALTYIWNFGDGKVEKGSSKVSYVYDKGGYYTVSVTVDDGDGSACSSASDSIKVRVNTPPTAGMASVKACCVDMEQKFDASASVDPDGDALTYSWDMGDGTTAQGVKVSHAYAKSGTYKVTLKVDDGSGTECSSSYAMEEIKVNTKPVPVIKIK